jgi:hypothetical protein
MKTFESTAALCLAALVSGCAVRPAYFGNDARVLRENGASFWEAPAKSPSYLQVSMRRRVRDPERDRAFPAIEYAGTLRLTSGAPTVMVSTFTLTEGGSTSFHYDFPNRYLPSAADVVVVCAAGMCRADSRPPAISPEGRLELKTRKVRTEARAPGAPDPGSLKMDKQCAILHDGLSGLRDQDAAAKRVERNYAALGCAAWLDEHGGVGAAWRRVRVAQWTSFRRD